MDFGTIAMLIFLGVVVISIIISVKMVSQNNAYVVERFGKYSRTMVAGLNFMVPFIETVAYRVSLKEMAKEVESQSAITKDNISLGIDGLVYLKVIDARKASYGIQDYVYAVIQLAQTTMRSEIGKMTLDKTFEEREALNTKIVEQINEAAGPWGVQVLRYEIKDIQTPKSVLDAMEKQMKAEREKRAVVLESEGARTALINNAEGAKRSQVLAAEADKEQQILAATGEAEAIRLVAEAKANAIKVVGKEASTEEGIKAVQFDIAQKAIDARKAIAKEGTIVLMDSEKNETANVVTQALAISSVMGKS